MYISLTFYKRGNNSKGEIMGTKERVEILNKKDTVINQLLKRIGELELENERLVELCSKYEEEHKTTFEEWKRYIEIVKELEKRFDNEPSQLEELNKGHIIVCYDEEKRR